MNCHLPSPNLSNNVPRDKVRKNSIEVSPDGYMMEIGECGIIFSGGQKACVSLACAMYSELANILLLDDPQSVIDAHVGDII
eukprot:788255-Ditylum_brightwellii.AAC.1